MDQSSKIDPGLEQEKKIEETLLSDRDAISKVRQMIKLGMEEEEATDLVERYQIGQAAPVYYERLEFDYDQDDELT